MNKFNLAFLALISITASGCSTLAANLERNLNDPNVLARVQEISERYNRRAEERESGVYGDPYEEIDLTGDWQLVGYDNRVNSIRHTYDGIMVTPNNGKPVFYNKIGPNLYESKGMTYEFITIHNGEWRSNGKRNKVIQLRRLTWG
ncbi:MAG: hypothetical protein AB2728_10195 [Candidatus Thiodiazotropha sp.]|nr:hypothetical protein [Candidatus Thiodiazotropha taylori]MBT3057427.1 hypothetical protein [Candidatus Thiodiazotropha sp. (ex Lucina pensylvanica)]MBV2094298.1 hypothetical protein [Candidatus Thiodiazotropha sp. (ex Codakia orbicularis)]PUB73577.1 MAG: hypothetical protein DBO99_19790 [gamma proteobacterium symbiont of Ctena orbiculata]MBT3062437.1 hypothetical protein [Candidatus Thiodiazotropha sp. (ex Lucina pensylvanica)]